MPKALPNFARLDPREIIATAERLASRIGDRFPGSGLSKVAATLVELAGNTESEALLLDKPNMPIRVAVGAVLVAGAACLVAVAMRIASDGVEGGGAVSLVQGIDSTMNIAILVGLGVVTLTQLESRWKRRRALASLHMLRSLAHVIDMHQLTKDPGATLASPAPRALPSPHQLPPAQLTRYLDYCSEMLSLLGKLAALYAQSHPDSAIAQTVNEIEMLATNLARKIWQKIAIVTQSGATVH